MKGSPDSCKGLHRMTGCLAFGHRARLIKTVYMFGGPQPTNGGVRPRAYDARLN